jgi:chaperonin cofactor prefoldin
VPVTTIVPDIEKETELKNQIDSLKKKNEELQLELNKLNNALNKLNKGTYMKNSDLSNLYDE